jgi:sugar lactone lactonase YvrE
MEITNGNRSLEQNTAVKTGEENMYATTTIENVTATTNRMSGGRRTPESSFSYILKGMRSVLGAAAIAVAAAGSALAGGNQALWIANGTNVVEFAKFQAVRDVMPRVSLNSSVFGAPQGVVFDSKNDLWVIDGGTAIMGGTIPPSLEEFTEAQLMNLKADPTPTPTVQITSTDLVFPQQAVFDDAGDLWVSDNGANAVFVVTPSQLASGVLPGGHFSTAIESNPSFNGPLGIVLHDGNLYIANNGTTTIFEFNADHLPSVGSGLTTLVPDVVLNDDGMGSIQAPWALIFDKAGDLWSSNANAPFTLVEFGPDQINATGDPTPMKTISPVEVKVSKGTEDESLSSPNGIAFDQKGDLFAISSASPFGVADYDPQDQKMGGSVKPDAFVAGANTTLNAPAGDNLGPEITN